MKLSRWLVLSTLMLSISPVFAATAQDIAGILRTFQSNLGPLYIFVVALAYVMGIWFIADSIYRLKKYGQQRTMMSTNASIAKPIILMALGLTLLYFPTFVNLSTETLWVYGSSSSVLVYPNEPTSWNAFVHPLIDTVRLFGLIAVVRGVVILTKLANESPQPGSLGKGLMHIIAGTLAINITGTINVIKATFGL